MLPTQIRPPSGSLAQTGRPNGRVRRGSSVKGQRRLSPLLLFLWGWGGKKGFGIPHPFLQILTHFVWFSVGVERNTMDLLGSAPRNATVDFDGQQDLVCHSRQRIWRSCRLPSVSKSKFLWRRDAACMLKKLGCFFFRTAEPLCLSF